MYNKLPALSQIYQRVNGGDLRGDRLLKDILSLYDNAII